MVWAWECHYLKTSLPVTPPSPLTHLACSAAAAAVLAAAAASSNTCTPTSSRATPSQGTAWRSRAAARARASRTRTSGSSRTACSRSRCGGRSATRCGAVRLCGCVAAWLRGWGWGRRVVGGMQAGGLWVDGLRLLGRFRNRLAAPHPHGLPPPTPHLPTHTHTLTRRSSQHAHTTTTCSRSLTQMFKLWFLADSDLLREGNRYTLTNTGQGLNRVQGAPSGVCGVRRAVECAAGEGWGQRRPGG